MKKNLCVIFTFVLCALLFFSAQVYADTSHVADASQMTTVQDVAAEGMEPVYAEALYDGVYEAAVDSSSSMFRIERCALRVEDGKLTAALTMSSESYGYLFPGTAEEAAAAAKSAYLTPGEDGRTFTLPIPALDAGVSCAAWSRSKELWYDRTLVFRSDSLPLTAFRDVKTAESLGLADGEYTVDAALEGVKSVMNDLSGADGDAVGKARETLEQTDAPVRMPCGKIGKAGILCHTEGRRGG